MVGVSREEEDRSLYPSFEHLMENRFVRDLASFVRDSM